MPCWQVVISVRASCRLARQRSVVGVVAPIALMKWNDFRSPQ